MASPNKQLTAWLDSEDGQTYLRECARSLLWKSKTLIAPKDRIFSEDHKNREQQIMSLSADIFLFILENPKVCNSLAEHIRRQDIHAAVRFLCQKYISYLKDIRRGSQGDFAAHLYRKVQLLLAKHPEMLVQTQKQRSYYAALPAKELPFLENDFYQMHSIKEWPYPQKEGKWVHEPDLVAWAAFFWDQTRSVAGYDCLVPVREYIYYLISKKCVDDPTAKFSAPVRVDENGEESDFLETVADPAPGSGISAEMLRELAQEVVSDWDGRMKTAFELRFNQDMSLNTIAESLDYAGPSGVSNVLQEAVSRLREQISSWPGLYSEEMDEAVSKEFFEYLYFFLQKRQ